MTNPLEAVRPVELAEIREARERIAGTISAGNAGQGVAYAARKAGIPCTVVAIETAPASKLERMQALGARLIPVSFTAAWQALDQRSHPGVEGARALSLAAALTGKAGPGPIVAIVSGGNIDLKKFSELIESAAAQ